MRLSTYEKLNQRRAVRFMWWFAGFIGMVLCLFILAIYVGYQKFQESDRFIEVKKVAGQTYAPNPRNYAKKEITDEIREKAEFEVLD